MPAGQQSEHERDFLSRWRLLVDKAGGSGGQARVAKKLGWTTSTVSRDYKGNTLPTDERLDQLCGFLGLPQKDALHLAALLQHARAARKSRLKASGTEAAEETDDKSWYQDGQRQESAPATQEQQTARVRPGTRREPLAVSLRAAIRSQSRSRRFTAAVIVVTAAVILIAVQLGWPQHDAKPPSQTKSLAQAKGITGLRPAVKGTYPGLRPKAVPIPVSSLTPSLAEAFRPGRTAAGATVTGFEFRNSRDTGLCLSAIDTGPTAGLNRDPVDVWTCTGAPNEIWIPEQWEIHGARFTRLVNDQYQSMCLNADNIGGLGNRHVVQLWNCYPAGNESWDFGDWQENVSSGMKSYPLFVEYGRLCLDVDKNDFRIGTPVHIWTQYSVAEQFWS